MRAHPALTVAIVSILAVVGCGKSHKTKAAPTFAGSYALTCQSITDLGGGQISAQCADAKGALHPNVLQAGACKGDIANMDGVLTCAGATASPAPTPSGAASDAVALKP